jgi:phosphoribosylamine--glycine ligase
VIGGTPNTDRLEADRGYAMDVLEANGVETVPHRVFRDFGEGVRFVEENPAPYVIKPLGEVQNVKRLLYVGDEADGSDVVEVLRAYEKAWGGRMRGFQLQRRVTGVEVAVCGFFDGDRFVDRVNLNFEHRRLSPGNVGPSTGEMGTSMFWAGRNRLFAETLGRLEEWLADEGYVGSIDLNCIVDANGVAPLELTPRFGSPTIALQEESFESPTGQFLFDLAHGNDPDLSVHRGFQVAVRVVLPPFPYTDETTYDENSRNAAAVFRNGREGVHVEDAKLVDGQWRVAGENGMPVVVTGTGDTMAAARAVLRPGRGYPPPEPLLPRRHRRAVDRGGRRPAPGVRLPRGVNPPVRAGRRLTRTGRERRARGGGARKAVSRRGRSSRRAGRRPRRRSRSRRPSPGGGSRRFSRSGR